MRILLVTPPMTQLNTPYPATAYLTGFLRLHAARLDLEIAQADAALELFLALFSRAGLTRTRAALLAGAPVAAPEPPLPPLSDASPAARAARAARVGRRRAQRSTRPASVESFLAHADRYLATIDATIRFLQGRDPQLALRIVTRELLPEGPRFAALAPAPDPDDDPDDPAPDDSLEWAFGALGVGDRAKHLASLYIDDLADMIREGIAPDFELARYGERLAASAPSFDPLRDALAGPPTLVDDLLDEVTTALVAKHRPDVLGLTAPFPGNLYGALRIARRARTLVPGLRVVLGGGYVNTELRELSDPRIFDDVDFLTLDDGEAPLLALLDHLRDPTRPLHRTLIRTAAGRVELVTDATRTDVGIRDTGTPTYDGLPLDRYISLFEMLNPMNRLWSDGRWNKLTIAHGCYWKQCTFCDVSLDYIARYDRAPADVLVDRIEALIAETGQTGFHFVDEAAPPAGLRALAERLLERGVTITWWGNVRFEKAFTPELAQLLARSGCVAISGGLEVASDRLLSLMKKGVTVEQVARVTRAFTDAGIMVHAYLMYGFPTQTAQDTIDALERVRQLFAAGCVQSAFWHRFTATVHSPIGKQPELYGITLARTASTFARNDVAFTDPTGTDHDAFAAGLRKALYNYMHGLGLDDDPRSWFTGRMVLPRTTVPADLIELALA